MKSLALIFAVLATTHLVSALSTALGVPPLSVEGHIAVGAIEMLIAGVIFLLDR